MLKKLDPERVKDSINFFITATLSDSQYSTSEYWLRGTFKPVFMLSIQSNVCYKEGKLNHTCVHRIRLAFLLLS